MRGTAREDLVTEHGVVARADDRLKQRGDALAADDLAQLARELAFALLLGIAHGIGSGLHSLINLPLQTNLRAVVDARRADEKTDLALLHVREAIAHDVDELLAEIVGDGV